MAILLYIIVLTCLSIYSYALVDPNLTLINSDIWVTFRNVMVQLGYYERNASWTYYLLIICTLYLFHGYFIKKIHKYNPIHIAGLVSMILLLSYPFLSRDFFNYIFDAKIITYYHENPYLKSALDFQTDSWLRFMHWTHRTYPYGPSWLLITLLPSLLSFGKFILNFIFFKLLFMLSYLATTYVLNKINKKNALFFASNPFVIMEGLVNAHNDFIALSFGIIGISLLLNKKNITFIKTSYGKISTWALLVISALIKYITTPIILIAIRPNNKTIHRLTAVGIVVSVTYLILTREMQPWYFLNFLILLPIFSRLIMKFNLFFAGLLLSYYPYIRLGDWTDKNNVSMKHSIILFFLVLNLVLLLYQHRRKILTAFGFATSK